MVLRKKATLVAEGFWLRAPDLESVLFVKTAGSLRSLAHTQVDLTDLGHVAGMSNGSREERAADARSSNSWLNVHPPDVCFMGGFSMRIAINADDTDQFGRERPENFTPVLVCQQLLDKNNVEAAVIFDGGRKGERLTLQRLAPEGS